MQKLQHSNVEIDISEGLLTNGIGHFDQFFGAWSMMPDRMTQQLNVLSSINVSAHVDQQLERHSAVVGSRSQGDDQGDFSRINGNIAVIEIRGTMTKHGASFARGGSTILARRRIRQAASMDSIGGILLVIDSPGGTVSGTKDLADDVFNANQSKPVFTFFEDTGASAAFYVGSQAGTVKANRSAVIGSIGTVLVLHDYSVLAERQGIKVHVVSTGDFKGAGAPGTEITKEQLAYFQNLIETGNEIFLEDAARGTGMSIAAIRKVADGRVFMAEEAVTHGLIDGTTTLDEAVSELSKMVSSGSSSRRQKMSETTTEPIAATTQELREACPGASAEFILEQADNKADLTTAMKAHAVAQQNAIAERDAELAKAKQEAADASAAANLPGNAPVNADTTDDSEPSFAGDPAAFQRAEIDTIMDRNATLPSNRQVTRREAAVAVAKMYPTLGDAVMEAHKPQPGRLSE